jgi:hypothetical protein
LTPEIAKRNFLLLTDMFGETFIVLMPLTFCCDETGIDGNSEWVGVVGYISSRERWGDFCNEWQTELNAVNLPFFHFAELAETLPRHVDIPSLVTRCADIASRNTIVGVGVFVKKDAYKSGMPDWYRQHVRLPEIFCLYQFLKIAFGEAEEHSFATQEKLPVSFVFDNVCPKSNSDWYNGIHRVYSHLKDKGNALSLIGCLSIDSKAGNTPFAKPLQGVDCLAYRMRQVLTYLPNVRPKPMDELIGRNIRMTYYDSATIDSAAKQVELEKNAILKI